MLNYKKFKKDYVLRNLSYNPIYFASFVNTSQSRELTPEFSIHDISCKSGRTLYGLLSFKNGKNSYFVKPMSYSSAAQNMIVSDFMRMMGQKYYSVPKEKLLFFPDFPVASEIRGYIPYNYTSASKKLPEIEQFENIGKMEQVFFPRTISDLKQKNLKKYIGYARLMAMTLILFSCDPNLQNFYQNPNGTIGKFDHDDIWQIFAIKKSYTDTYSSIPAVHFIESLIFDTKRGGILKIKANEDEFQTKVDEYLQMDGLIVLDEKCRSNYCLNTDFITEDMLNDLKKDKVKLFMFVSFLQCIEDMLNMPQEIIDYKFSEESLGEDFKKATDIDKKCILVQLEVQKSTFLKSLSSFKEKFTGLIARMDEFKQALGKRLTKEINKSKVDYTVALEALQAAREQGLSLNQLKKQLHSSLSKAEPSGEVNNKKRDIQQMYQHSIGTHSPIKFDLLLTDTLSSSDEKPASIEPAITRMDEFQENSKVYELPDEFDESLRGSISVKRLKHHFGDSI